jgi:hypothetical protein
MYERSILGGVLGLPGYAAIGIALGFTGLGVFIDLTRISGLGTIFKGCYFVGCVLAVCWVKRRALFGPMVQPPLLLAIAVPAVVLASGDNGTGDSGLTDHLLSIGTPLINGFPTMAVATAFAVAIGICRYVLQREDADVAFAVPPRHPVPPSASGLPRRPATDRAASRGPREPGERRRPADRTPGDRTPVAERSPGGRVPGERPRGERRSAADRSAADRQPGERRPPTDRGPSGRAPRERPGPERAPRERSAGPERPPRERPGSERPGAGRSGVPERSGERSGGDRRSDPLGSAGTDRRPPPERRSARPPADRPPARKPRTS